MLWITDGIAFPIMLILTKLLASDTQEEEDRSENKYKTSESASHIIWLLRNPESR